VRFAGTRFFPKKGPVSAGRGPDHIRRQVSDPDLLEVLAAASAICDKISNPKLR
jgi:hypothetical protein